LRNVKEGKGLDVNNVTQAQEGESFNHSLAVCDSWCSTKTVVSNDGSSSAAANFANGFPTPPFQDDGSVEDASKGFKE
jgi:hypothetical protein